MQLFFSAYAEPVKYYCICLQQELLCATANKKIENIGIREEEIEIVRSPFFLLRVRNCASKLFTVTSVIIDQRNGHESVKLDLFF